MSRRKARPVTLPGELFPRGTPVWVMDKDGSRPDHPGIYMGKIMRFGLMHWVSAKKGSKAGWCLDGEWIKPQANGDSSNG